MRRKRLALLCASCATTRSSTALSRKRSGEVSLLWRIDDSEAEPKLEMIWQERGGPPVNPEVGSGFGKVVIERLTAAGLNASSILSFEPDGVIWRLIAPLKDIVKTGPRRSAVFGAVGQGALD